MDDYRADMTRILRDKLEDHQFSKNSRNYVRSAIDRIYDINESKTFVYSALREFEGRLTRIEALKEFATAAFKPFADDHGTTLCESMGFPMMDAIENSHRKRKYDAFFDILGVTNYKAKIFGLEALKAAMAGERNDIPESYNIVFDRDTPWTYRNEAGHMEEYARYHFNSYVISELNKTGGNPFDPVISLYEEGACDFIFMRTQEDGKKEVEKLATFHTVEIPGNGKVLGVHFHGDNGLKYYRRWGDPYTLLKSVKDEHVKLKVTGIADQRYEVT